MRDDILEDTPLPGGPPLAEQANHIDTRTDQHSKTGLGCHEKSQPKTTTTAIVKLGRGNTRFKNYAKRHTPLSND